ncbi:MAG: hypothetical protein ACOH13_00045 [Flavobacteriales bacterium]
MISNYLPISPLDDAPPVVHELRNAFDGLLETLYGIATEMQIAHPDRPTKMLHIPFAHKQYDVEAMYDAEQDLFTQLVARPKSAQINGRPSYTISLFLVADAGDISVNY